MKYVSLYYAFHGLRRGPAPADVQTRTGFRRETPQHFLPYSSPRATGNRCPRCSPLGRPRAAAGRVRSREPGACGESRSTGAAVLTLAPQCLGSRSPLLWRAGACRVFFSVQTCDCDVLHSGENETPITPSWALAERIPQTCRIPLGTVLLRCHRAASVLRGVALGSHSVPGSA